MYKIDFTHKAIGDIEGYRKSGQIVVIKKISTLLKEMAQHPFTGTGKPEALKHKLTGLYSRRINREHRIVYQVMNNEIVVHSLKGHYE
ncbi:MAG: Txe/YoeB family addiction module toxin [Bacteroidia bacterium]